MITRAPAKAPWGSQPWLDWLTQIGVSFSGKWGNEERRVNTSGFNEEPTQKIVNLSNSAFLYELTVDNVSLSSAVVTLPYKVSKTLVRIYDDENLLETVIVEGDQLILTDQTNINLIIKETLFRS